MGQTGSKQAALRPDPQLARPRIRSNPGPAAGSRGLPEPRIAESSDRAESAQSRFPFLCLTRICCRNWPGYQLLPSIVNDAWGTQEKKAGRRGVVERFRGVAPRRRLRVGRVLPNGKASGGVEAKAAGFRRSCRANSGKTTGGLPGTGRGGYRLPP